MYCSYTYTHLWIACIFAPAKAFLCFRIISLVTTGTCFHSWATTWYQTIHAPDTTCSEVLRQWDSSDRFPNPILLISQTTPFIQCLTWGVPRNRRWHEVSCTGSLLEKRCRGRKQDWERKVSDDGTNLTRAQPTQCGALEQILPVREILHWAEVAGP